MWLTVVATLIVTFFIANAIAWFLEALRGRRLRRHAEMLAKAGPVRVPLTVVTGFLGAGKTTLVNNILTAQNLPYRIAIIENEVGAVSIDHALLEHSLSDPSKGIYVLQNGCMCCMATGPGSELDRTISRLSTLCEMNTYDYVLVELSGLADPGPILRFFSAHDMADGRFYLDGVVAVVDCTTAARFVAPAARQHVDHPVEARRQVAYADVVLLNKTDRATEEQVHGAREAVEAVNPAARIINTQHARVPLERILGINAFGSLDTPAVSRLAEAVEEHAHEHEHEHEHEEHGEAGQGARGRTPGDDAAAGAGERCVHHHATSVAIRIGGPVDSALLREALSQLVDDLGERLYRVKGIVCVEGSDRHLVLQGVCAHLEALTGRPLEPGADRSGTIVFIGQGLDEGALRDALRSCTAETVEVVTNAVEVEQDEQACRHEHHHHHADDRQPPQRAPRAARPAEAQSGATATAGPRAAAGEAGAGPRRRARKAD